MNEKTCCRCIEYDKNPLSLIYPRHRNFVIHDFARSSEPLTESQNTEIVELLKRHDNSIRDKIDKRSFTREKLEVASVLEKNGFATISSTLRTAIACNAPAGLARAVNNFQIKYNVTIYALNTTIDTRPVILLLSKNNLNVSERKRSLLHEAFAISGNTHDFTCTVENDLLNQLHATDIEAPSRSTNLTTYTGRYKLLISELKNLLGRDRELTIADFGCGFDSEKFIPVSLLETKQALDPNGDRQLKFIAEDQIYPFYVLASEGDIPSLIFDDNGKLIAFKSTAGHLVDCQKQLKVSYRSHDVRKKERAFIIKNRALYEEVLQVKLDTLKEIRPEVKVELPKYKLIKDPLLNVIKEGVDFVYDSAFGISKKESIDVGIVYNVFLHYSAHEAHKFIKIMSPQIKEGGYLIVGEILDYGKESVKEEVMVFKKENGHLRRYEFIFWVKPGFDERPVVLSNCNACITPHQYEKLSNFFRTKEYYDSGEILGYETFNPRAVVEDLRRRLGIVALVHETDAVLIEFDSQGKLKKLPEHASSKEVPKLNVSIKAIRRWKERNRKRPIDDAYIRELKRITMDLYNHNRIYRLPIGQRMIFSRIVFNRKDFPVVNAAVSSIFRTLTAKDCSCKIDPKKTLPIIPPEAYHILANRLSVYEGQCSMEDNRTIRFLLNVIIFDFIRVGEKRVAELLWLIDEIEKELAEPGTGKLPVIIAMQDLHGGSRRALALIGHAMGLHKNIYHQVHNIDDLKLALEEQDINIRNMDIRFIGMNDKYDRGEDPSGVFGVVEWLRNLRKAKPFVGNHDFWRLISVLGVHLVPGVSKERNHGIGYWSEDAMKHAGWGTIELDQINEWRFNIELERVNTVLQVNDLEPFKKIDIGKFRASIDKEMKEIKKLNADIRRHNELHKDDPTYQRKEEHPLPNIFIQTLDYLRTQHVHTNTKIAILNEDKRLNIHPIEYREVNLENYREDPDIIARTLWELKNFRLYYIDVLGNIHLHNILPMDFEHRLINVVYKGRRGLAALELMQEDVRQFFEHMRTIPNSESFRMRMWETLGKAFLEINRWYSDKEAHAKPVSVKKFIDCGGPAGFGGELIGASVKQFADRKSMFLMIIGHNERKKYDDPDMPVPWIYLSPETDSGLANIDYELSQGYKDRGAYLSFFLRDKKGEITGIRQWGFPLAEKGAGQKQSQIRRIKDITLEDINGLDVKQIEMLKMLKDGKKFMTWYRKKALKEIERHLSLLVEEAGKVGRFVKEEKFLKMQVAVFKKLSDS